MTTPSAPTPADSVATGPGLDVLGDLIGGPRVDDLLRRAAERTPSRLAVRSPAGDLTYRDLDERVTACASALHPVVGGPGGVVALALALDPVFPTAFFGIVRAGGVAALVNPLLREEALAHVLRLAGARAVIATPVMAERIERVRDRIPELDTILLTRRPSDVTDELSGLTDLEELVGAASSAPPPAAPPADPDALAVLQFTSGTTGLPKGVRLSHRNLSVNAAQTAHAHRVTSTSVLFDHLPTFHLMHLTTPIAAGATLVLWPDDDLVGSVDAAAEFGATHYYSLPMRLSQLAVDPRLPGHGVPTLEAVLSGGSGLPALATNALAAHFGVPVVQGYGLQETSPLTHCDSLDRPRLRSCGTPVAGTECRVVDVETRAVLPVGAKGEIQVRGPQLMLGYLDGGNSRCLDPDEWFSTGDVGYVDTDGYLFLVDRIKDVFKCDNWLVSPTEIEDVLRTHPAVADCVVVDVPDPHSGAVALGVVLPKRSAVDRQELIAFVAERLPYYQHLRAVEFVGEIQRSPTGKVQRRDLRSRVLSQMATTDPMVSHRPGGVRVFTLINRFTVTGDTDEFEAVLENLTNFMIKQPGFRTHRLYHSAKEPKIYVEISEWDDPSGHRQAMGSDEFKGFVQQLMKVTTADPAPFTILKSYDVAVAK
ncbi:AMP-binding protein [Micromonospora sp. NPDC047548]|uniref:AMP-binding protein n=1 Tax=Micromonospora sp. NPDC047548 TaxID=3155624 RepID=UPI0033CF4048